jgi:sigma-B regulation protein RsbU (phosphoserine phosphatase)
VAVLRDWLSLGKSTIDSLTTDDVAGLYSNEWAETRDVLLADHLHSIAREPRRVKRWLRTASAMMHGLVKRLSPVRRLLFVVGFVWFFLCLFTLFTGLKNAPVSLMAELAAAFVLINVLLAMELIDKIKFRDELALARDLQATLIPKHPPRTASYDIAAFNHIANTVGGDLYDFVPLDDGRVAVLFGDASGHGMAAGLVMAVAHASFRTQLDIDPSPAAIVGSLNRILCRTGSSRSFFASCYVLLSPDGSYTATMAGHPPILKVDAAGKVVDRIGEGAYPLGIKAGLVWNEVAGTLAFGERLIMHSDGLTESRDREGREFGDPFVEAVIGWNGTAPAAAMVGALVAEWQKFSGKRPVEDDVSIAVIEKR